MEKEKDQCLYGEEETNEQENRAVKQYYTVGNITMQVIALSISEST